jgi:hypothetical protein
LVIPWTLGFGPSTLGYSYAAMARMIHDPGNGPERVEWKPDAPAKGNDWPSFASASGFERAMKNRVRRRVRGEVFALSACRFPAHSAFQ